MNKKKFLIIFTFRKASGTIVSINFLHSTTVSSLFSCAKVIAAVKQIPNASSCLTGIYHFSVRTLSKRICNLSTGKTFFSTAFSIRYIPLNTCLPSI